MRKSDSFAIYLSSGRVIQLREGVRLNAQDVLGLQTRAGGGAFAEVVRNPNDPTVLGLKNLSGQAWSATVPDGSQRRVEPGRSLKLEMRTKLNFGAIVGEVQERQGRFSLGLPSGQTVALKEGVRLRADDLLGLGGAGSGGPTAAVVHNPNDPTVLGLQNLSSQDWLATVPDGRQQRISPGRSIRLAAATKINFGTVTGEIEGPAATNVPLDARPYFDAALAHPPPRLGPRSGSGQGTQTGPFDWRELRPYVLSGGVVLLYALLTRSLTAPVVAIALAWAMRQGGDQLDAVLSPLWPYRDLLPPAARSVLAWVAPITVGYAITLSPSLFAWLTWLPGLDPDASVFTCTTVIAALVAYLLVHEPQRRATR